MMTHNLFNLNSLEITMEIICMCLFRFINVIEVVLFNTQYSALDISSIFFCVR